MTLNRAKKLLARAAEDILMVSKALGPEQPKATRKLSAEGREAISRAAKKRWRAWRKAQGGK